MVDSIVGSPTTTTPSTGTQPVENNTDTTSVPAEFDELMRSMLTADGSGQVSEEELFAANCGEKISTLKGTEALEKYKTALSEERGKVTGGDGFVQQETAAINALKRLVADGTITAEEGDAVYTDAFNSSQLDFDTTSLFDSKGGVNDPTTAMAMLSSAIAKVNEAKASATALTPETTMSLASASATGGGATKRIAHTDSIDVDGLSTITPNGTYVDGAKGFLFKPVTNNEGTLAVLGAEEWTGNISSVSLVDSLGNVLEEGKQQLDGVSETGQEKWVFSKQGGNYPDNITVQIHMLDGSLKNVSNRRSKQAI